MRAGRALRRGSRGHAERVVTDAATYTPQSFNTIQNES